MLKSLKQCFINIIIISINAINFQSMNVKDITCMFFVCFSLTLINETNFDSMNFEIMGSMFLGYYSLI